MKTNIECELRGPITWGDFLAIKPIIEQQYGPFTRTVELALFAKGDNDLRIKINNKRGHLILKYRTEKDKAKFEREVEIKPGDFMALLDILDRLGEKKWVVSRVDKHETKSSNFSISFKFGSKIGDFFEIEEIIEQQNNINSAINRIKDVAKRLNLTLWDNETFKRISHQSWEGIIPAPLIINEDFHPSIKKFIEDINNITTAEEAVLDTISSRLKNRNNDYSSLEERYRNFCGKELLSWEPLRLEQRFFCPISVVIPTYNSAKTLIYTINSIINQSLNQEEWKLLEVIVVDDGSNDNTAEIITRMHVPFLLRYIHQNNIGRASARNLGANFAKGDVLIFLDSDVVLERHFIREHAVRHNLLDNIVLISFKENVDILDKRISNFVDKPNIKKDFRFKKEVKPEWLRMHRHVRNIEVRKVKIIEETNNLKSFGNDKVIGVWDLPSMVVTNAVSLKRNYFDTIGGFNLQFQGWGMEDTFLGACLIALGCFVIPVFSTGIFHIEHTLRSGSEEKLIKEFNKNVLVYLDLIHQPTHSVFKKLNE
jgi:predicted adenylyl cyclase CyaB